MAVDDYAWFTRDLALGLDFCLSFDSPDDPMSSTSNRTSAPYTSSNRSSSPNTSASSDHSARRPDRHLPVNPPDGFGRHEHAPRSRRPSGSEHARTTPPRPPRPATSPPPERRSWRPSRPDVPAATPGAVRPPRHLTPGTPHPSRHPGLPSPAHSRRPRDDGDRAASTKSDPVKRLDRRGRRTREPSMATHPGRRRTPAGVPQARSRPTLPWTGAYRGRDVACPGGVRRHVRVGSPIGPLTKEDATGCPRIVRVIAVSWRPDRDSSRTGSHPAPDWVRWVVPALAQWLGDSHVPRVGGVHEFRDGRAGLDA
jgi:hypothetical protein